VAKNKPRNPISGATSYLTATIVVLLIVAGGLYVAAVHSKYSTRIGVINLTGEITDFRYTEQIKAAINDPSIQAVVVKVNSPGGYADACFQTELQLSQLNSQKPVVVTMDETCASGAYLISSASSYIYAHDYTVTAGLGVIAYWVDYSAAYENSGIKIWVWKSGGGKDEFAPWRGPTEKENQEIQEEVDRIAAELFATIRHNRPQTENILENLSDGSTIYGSNAVSYKLVDAIGDYSAAVGKAAMLAGLGTGEYIVIDLTNPPGFWGALRKSL
jgi:protease-4